MRLLFALAISGSIGCSAGESATPPALPPARTQSFVTTIRSNGFSDAVEFSVPPHSRSITVVVKGVEGRLYALGALRLADGVERVNLDASASYGAVMRDAYVTEQSGAMPGDLYQTIRLGTFTHVYPHAPGQETKEGRASLRVVSDATEGEVSVRVYMPEDDGASTLHINALAVSETLEMSTSPGFLGPAQKIFDQAGIKLVVDGAFSVKGSGLSSMLDFNEPQEPPGGGAAALAALGAAQTTTPALNVFVIDRLVSGVAGLSLGTPGPPDEGSYYFGVILRSAPDAELARVFAHEVCHFMALQHVVNKGVSGKLYPDPIDDTSPGVPNLMEDGTTLTPGQIFALSRSALLTK